MCTKLTLLLLSYTFSWLAPQGMHSWLKKGHGPGEYSAKRPLKAYKHEK